MSLVLFLLTVSTQAFAVEKAYVHCPSGTHIVGFGPPGGDAQGCERDDGTKHGPFVLWHLAGKPAQTGEFKDGKLHGHSVSFYEDGKKKSEGDYDEGKLTGKWERWTDKGKLKDSGAWKNGVPEGFWTTWYPSGKKSSEGYFDDGRRVCKWTYWDEKMGTAKEKQEKESSTCLLGIRGFDLNHFRAGLDAMFQSQNGRSYSSYGAWAPEFGLTSWLALGTEIGVSAYQRGDKTGIFLRLETVFRVILRPLHPFQVEFVGGAQHWIDYGGSQGSVGFNIVWVLDQKVFGLVDRIVFGVTGVESRTDSNEAKLGLGITF